LWNAAQLQGTNVGATAPANGQILKFNGTSWAPATEQTLSVTGSSLTISNGNTVTLPSGGSGSISGTANYIPKFTGTSAIGNSSLYQTTTGLFGIGTITPIANLDILSNNDSIPLMATYNSTNFMPNGVVRGVNNTPGGTAVLGYSLNDETNIATVGVGGYGTNIGVQAQGEANTTTDGVVFGVYSAALAVDTSVGVYGIGQPFDGTSVTPTGVKYGLYGIAYGGTSNYAVYGTTLGQPGFTNYAGYFDGNVQVVGSISKSAGTFKIDDPIDPANKYLYHSFVESPDMMNVYNGNITTDGSGYATIELPQYFEALNKDYRYQLTVVGGTFAQAIVSKKVQGNKFQIRTNEPNIEVSWQVTGIRQDAYANAHRVQPEVDKEPENKGLYLHPLEMGKDVSLKINAQKLPKKVNTADLKKAVVRRK
jgi:hypothetical protein